MVKLDKMIQENIIPRELVLPIILRAKKGTIVFQNTTTGKHRHYRFMIPYYKPNLLYVLSGSGATLATIDITTKHITPNVGEEANAFHWIYYHLMLGTLPAEMVALHTGSCIRCDRELTDPISIALGIGPECSGSEIRKQYKLMIKEHDNKM